MAIPTSAAHLSPAGVTHAPAAVKLWLTSVTGLVFAMIIVGGATRLTDSGLSMTEWQPILGAIPPLSDADWQLAFSKYKQIPEYREINRGMSLEAFKYIFWWEWGHRFLGRLIGLAFAIPLMMFWLRGLIPVGFAPRLFALLALGAVQGGVGWYMVQSGLADRVDVSPYRLALHLSIAFLIFALLIWTRLDMNEPRPRHSAAVALRPVHLWLAASLLALVLLQAAVGGFVAGLKAGLTYNTWPLMDGEFIPSGMYALAPWYVNLFENITTVQFNHRIAAYVICALAATMLVAAVRDNGTAALRLSAAAVLAGVLVQAMLGIWTLLSAEGAIPLTLGLLHQGGGAAVLGLAVWHCHRVYGRRTA
ncbi:MAG: COX15/CtaA family protein [Pseudomonadota bacterium]